MERPFTDQEYQERHRRVLAEMARQELDVLLVVRPDDMYWLTGYDSIGYFSHQVLFVYGDGRPTTLLTRVVEELPARWSTAGEHVLWRVQEGADPVAETVQVLRAKRMIPSRVGLQLDSYYLSTRTYLGLRDALSACTLLDASSLVALLRSAKSPAEQEYARRAAHYADLGMEAALRALRPGMTEFELAAEAEAAMVRAGSEYPGVPTILGSGPRSAYMHATPTQRAIQRGDVIILEFGGVSRRYHVTIGRTLLLGEPSPRVRAVFATVRRAVDAAQALVRPGVHVETLDDVTIREMEAGGLGRARVHRTGYGLGIGYPPSWLEELQIVRGYPFVLREGMIFSLEPPAALPDEGFGIKLIDDVLVTADGSETMSRIPRELLVAE